MGNFELRPLNSRSPIRAVRTGLTGLSALLCAIACNGPTREYYNPEEEGVGGAATSSGGATTTTTSGVGGGATTSVGGVAGNATAAGGSIGASGASTGAGGAGLAGAPGNGGTASSVGGSGDGGAVGLGGAVGVGGILAAAGSIGVGGTVAVGGAIAVGGTAATAGTTATGGTLGNGGASGSVGVGGGPAGKQLGQGCVVGAECASTYCVDGLCCTEPACPACMNCGATGLCNVAVINRADTTGKTCQTDATGVRMCDAKSVCSMPHLIRDVNQLSYTLNGVTNTYPSYPRNFTQGPDRRVYFGASDGSTGDELWVTDGTAAGTSLVADLVPNAGNSSPRGLINAGNYLYFSAFDTTGIARLFATNGTPAGTHIVKDLGNSAFGGNMLVARNIGNVIYFTGCGAAAGCELWRSDGTDAGTVMVADIMTPTVSTTSTQTFGSFPSELTVMGNSAVYFRAASAIVVSGTTNVVADYELWKSDGIATNTVRVVDIEPGVGNGMPTNLMAMPTLNGPRLLFAASRGASNQELYITNGSVGDSASVDINPGASGSNPGPFVMMGNRAYFGAADSTNGRELWATDGTVAGTYLVKDIYPGSTGSSPSVMEAAGNFLYFRASDNGSSMQLWRTDGTANGTAKVFDAFTPAGASLFDMAAFGNSGSVFMCTGGSGIQELWITDGTTAGTYPTCRDRNQPCGVPFASNPSDLTVIDGRMYFNATALPTVGGSLGAEPYVYP